VILSPLSFSVCQQHAHTLTPRSVSPLLGRREHHSHVPEADATHQLPGILAQRPSVVAESMENRHKFLKEQIHEDLGVQLFVDHIRALTASLDPKLADVRNPLVR
jgi:hypothetical protein